MKTLEIVDPDSDLSKITFTVDKHGDVGIESYKCVPLDDDNLDVDFNYILSEEEVSKLRDFLESALIQKRTS